MDAQTVQKEKCMTRGKLNCREKSPYIICLPQPSNTRHLKSFLFAYACTNQI